MKKAGVLISFLMLSFSWSAMAHTFAACEGIEVKKFLQEDAYIAFTKAFKSTFDRLDTLSREEINANKSCLEKDSDSAVGCKDRIAYFKKTLPIEWKKYRKSFALSGWNKQFLVTKDAGQDILDMSPNGSDLDATERKEVLDQFTKETDLIFRKSLQELETAEKRTKDASVTNIQGRQLLTMKNWSYLLRSNNYWALKVTSRVEQLVFHLNTKRMIQQRLKHPILAHLKEQNLDNGALFAAMDSMNRNLDEENTLVSGLVKEVTTGSDWWIGTLYPLVDYLNVTSITLQEHPEHCSAAQTILTRFQTQETFKAVASLTAGIGLMFVAPLPVALGGVALIQGYSIYEADERYELARRGSLTNPDPELAMRTGEETFMANENVKTEIMMSPFLAIGSATLRFTKLLLVFI